MLRKSFLPIAAFFILSIAAFAGEGKLLVRCNVPAKVYLNGIPVGESGDVISGLPTGTLKLKVAAEGFEPHEEEIALTGEGTLERKIELRRKSDAPTAGEEPPKAAPKPEPKEEPKTPDKPEEPKAGEPKNEGEKPRKEDETSKPKAGEQPAAQAAATFTEDDVKKASKDGDKTKLLEIMKSKSDYRIRLIAASALLRLKDSEGTAAVDKEIDAKFGSAPKGGFSGSPFIESGRTVKETVKLTVALNSKAAKVDSYEDLAAAYLTILALVDRREDIIAQIDNVQGKVDDRKKGRGWGMQRAVHQGNLTIEDLKKEEKENIECTAAVAALIKKASKSSDKDLAALAGVILKRVDELINPEKKKSD